MSHAWPHVVIFVACMSLHAGLEVARVGIWDDWGFSLALCGLVIEPRFAYNVEDERFTYAGRQKGFSEETREAFVFK